ncbi:TonB-dependent receptor plug domain-containing protein [Neolewinella lacunae]|uniref:TonB-dependent receptor plug domain-containing protein n=1 Tax=Neolewinella lacunae TaxID=1517758 RepID=A0A923T757_9BACT|nr:TonB-dependent receptor [Neolewinella lacunae]MBC6994135.1 TonB-dependent receptor plug domain-containing protein [Neolewinella lacunae]MDN3636716.1 TonB-dependent receptor plug domain-containing protein [Neolewinella lacunae]
MEQFLLRHRVLSFFFLLACVATPGVVPGQNVQGRVQSEAGTPLLGAYVSLAGSDTHTHSDEFGNFLIRGVNTGDTLLTTYLGFKPARVIVRDPEARLKIVLEESYYDLGEIVVKNNSREFNLVSAIDVEIDPVKSSQEILRKVPGLFIGQHAGGGKAEQLFLRGFDIDHGTDIAIAVDGMPVNMVSHAHGQGYADLHFLIPETVDKIDFGKGPYYADVGNFNTAGYVNFQTKDRLESSQIGLEVGNFNTFRTLGMVSLLDTANRHAYVAAEYLHSDGPFESSQNFYRNNLMAKYSGVLDNGLQFSLLASHFESEWDASGQIPERAVADGTITRFGAIDDTEGGNTSRTNVALELSRLMPKNSFVKANMYYSLYDFELFSNFTFFLEDPVNGDQIRQVEDRRLFGFESSYNKVAYLGDVSALFRIGAGLRADRSEGNSLSRTLNRTETLEIIQQGDVDERNLYAFADAEFDVGNFVFRPGLRYDYFQYNYLNDLTPLYDPLGQTRGKVTPKFSAIYNASNDVQLFFKTGIGFHSNDTRVVLEQDNREILPSAYGADLGAIFKPLPRMVANVALWYLKLDQEFVYVGDAGIVEPSGETRRYGIDVGLRYQAADWLYATVDYTYTRARSLEAAEGEDLIPLAPISTLVGALNAIQGDFTGGIRLRYLGDRPANEDNSIVAKGYTVVDFNANYNFRPFTLGLTIDNLLDVDWNETQFATESRLRNELNSVEEIHFTPGTPFQIRGVLRYTF